MTNQQGQSSDVESRLRRSFSSLGAGRALLHLVPPAFDDAVNRASAAALHAARALVDSQWAKDSQPGWDPEWRPGMPRSLRLGDRSAHSLDALHRLLDRFDRLAAGMNLPSDFTQYLRTLVEDGLEADTGEAPGYDADEARMALELAGRMVASVADRLGLLSEYKAAAERWEPLLDTITEPEGEPVVAGEPAHLQTATATRTP